MPIVVVIQNSARIFCYTRLRQTMPLIIINKNEKSAIIIRTNKCLRPKTLTDHSYVYFKINLTSLRAFITTVQNISNLIRYKNII